MPCSGKRLNASGCRPPPPADGDGQRAQPARAALDCPDVNMGEPGSPIPLREGVALPNPPTGWGDGGTWFPYVHVRPVLRRCGATVKLERSILNHAFDRVSALPDHLPHSSPVCASVGRTGRVWLQPCLTIYPSPRGYSNTRNGKGQQSMRIMPRCYGVDALCTAKKCKEFSGSEGLRICRARLLLPALPGGAPTWQPAGAPPVVHRAHTDAESLRNHP